MSYVGERGNIPQNRITPATLDGTPRQEIYEVSYSHVYSRGKKYDANGEEGATDK